MAIEHPGKFCPTCKLKNDYDATICVHCGVSLVRLSSEKPITEQNKPGGTALLPQENGFYQTLTSKTPPEQGFAIYVADSSSAYEIRTDEEFVIGRKTEDNSANMVDLSDFDAVRMGVSRRHVSIQKNGNGYEIFDLNSTNGTWLNGEKLSPYLAYPIPNGSQIRLGHMYLSIVYKIRQS